MGIVVALGCLLVPGIAAAPAGATSSICFHDGWSDPPNAGVDVRAFGLSYDCGNQRFVLDLYTAEPIPSGVGRDYAITVWLDTDRNSSDSCNGADYRVYLQVLWFGGFNSSVVRTPTCDQNTWSGTSLVVGGEQVTPTHEQIDWASMFNGSPASLRYWGSLNFVDENASTSQTDRFPDTGSISASCYLTPARASISGYWLAVANGDVDGYGDVGTCQGRTNGPVARPIVGTAATPDHRGVWSVASDGGIFTAGDARFLGSTGALHLNRPIVGMAPTPSGNGYWLVASDGGIFSFGDARFFGSTGALKLNRPIVGMGATPSGHGYWLVASDGGIFSFGDARFFGSTGALKLNRQIVGMAATRSGNGYWLVASDGGIFSFGDAHFYGSTGALRLASPIVGMGATASGHGYRFVANDGGVFDYGDAHFAGSLAGTPLPPGGVVGLAS